MAGLQLICDCGTHRMHSNHYGGSDFFFFFPQFVFTDSSRHWRYSEQKWQHLWPNMFIARMHGLSLEADSLLTAQENTLLLWNVLYGVYKRWQLHCSIQSTSSHHTSFRSILVIFTHRHIHTLKQFQATKFQTRNFCKKNYKNCNSNIFLNAQRIFPCGDERAMKRSWKNPAGR